MTESVNWAAMLDESADAFELVPVGKYTVQVDSAEATTSSTGKLMYKIKMSVTSGKHTGATLYNNVVLTPDNKKAMAMFFRNMDALGVSAQFLRGQPTPTPDQVAGKMIGTTLQVEVEHREWQGVNREEVKSMTKLQGAAGGLPSAPGGAPLPPPTNPAF